MKEKGSMKIVNGSLITPYRIINSDINIDNGIISSILPQIDVAADDQVIDASGFYVLPGLIDLHAHGGGGFDFMDATEEAFINAGKMHLSHGVTTMLPTTLSSSLSGLQKVLKVFKNLRTEEGIPYYPGLHLEGPYFSYAQKGAQDGKYIKPPEAGEYNEILKSHEIISRWSIAPELPGACELSSQLRKLNIVASIAHTDATYPEILESMENGFSMMTHFYSGMSGVTRKNAYRVAGSIESGYLINDLNVEVIADGSHLPPELLQLIYQVKGSGSVSLISDAIRAAGLGEGEFLMGSDLEGQKVLVEDSVAKLPDRSAFAGSVTMGTHLLKVMYESTRASLEEVVKMMTVNPAKILCLENRKGVLSRGMDADIVIMDRDFVTRYVIVHGSVVYSA